MRIAVFTGVFPHISETFVLNQLTGLLDRGHEVDVYADAPPPNATVHPQVHAYGLLARTHHRPPVPAPFKQRITSALRILARDPNAVRAVDPRQGRAALSLRLIHAAAPVLPRKRYDAIHCHFGPNGSLALKLRQIGAIDGPIATTFHGYDVTSWIRQHGERHYAELFAGGDLFLPISDRWRARLIELGCPANKIAVHHMGVDPAHFAFEPRTLAKGEKVRLISIARLVDKKGIGDAVEAVKRLAARGLPVEYTVVGDGPLRGQLEKQAENAPIHFAGWRDGNEVAGLLRRSHLLVAPSVTGADGDQEGIPVALMEAMACGLPIVTTRHSGIPELVHDGVSGLLVPEHDPAALADALARLIDKPGTWPTLGRAGRAHVEAEFDIHRLNDRLVELLASSRRS